MSASRLSPPLYFLLRLAIASVFLIAATAKVLGDASMVSLFDAIGFGQWFMYWVAFAELAGALMLLVPSTVGVGATMVTFIALGAWVSHLLATDAFPVVSFLLVLACGFVVRQDVRLAQSDQAAGEKAVEL